MPEDNAPYQGFFSPLEPGPEDLIPVPKSPAIWDGISWESAPSLCPIAYFAPHLSQRSQRILKELGVQTVGDVQQLTRQQIFGCERGGELVLLELREILFRPKGLLDRWDDVES
jgi:hypothetical protein